MIARVRPPELGEVEHLRAGQTLISFFYPGQNTELLEQVRATGANVIAMDIEALEDAGLLSRQVAQNEPLLGEVESGEE